MTAVAAVNAGPEATSVWKARHCVNVAIVGRSPRNHGLGGKIQPWNGCLHVKLGSQGDARADVRQIVVEFLEFGLAERRAIGAFASRVDGICGELSDLNVVRRYIASSFIREKQAYCTSPKQRTVKTTSIAMSISIEDWKVYVSHQKLWTALPVQPLMTSKLRTGGR